MGNKLRIFSVTLFLVFLVGFTNISSAQENMLGVASSSSPDIVKNKVKKSIEIRAEKNCDY